MSFLQIRHKEVMDRDEAQKIADSSWYWCNATMSHQMYQCTEQYLLGRIPPGATHIRKSLNDDWILLTPFKAPEKSK
jgi:hypothetical protein